MKKWHGASMIVLLSLVLLIPHASAQETASPLIIAGANAERGYFDTDLYQVDEQTGQLTPLTSDGLKSSYRLSPDGGRIVYLTAPDVVRQAAAEGNDFLIGAVWDIEVLDAASGERTAVAVQPDDADLLETAQIRGGVTRSAPVWSPDGAMLAWAEQDYPASGDASPRLMVYEFASDATRVLDAALPALVESADGLPRHLDWGQSGIAVFSNDPASEDLIGTLRVYHPDDGLLRSIPVSAMLVVTDHTAPPMTPPLWVQDGASEILIIQLADRNWYRADALTGEVKPFVDRADTIERVSAADPDRSLRLTWAHTGEGLFEWQILTPGGDFAHAWGATGFPDHQSMAVAQSGDAVAYWQDGLVIWRDSGKTTLDVGAMKNLTLLWGAQQWRVQHVSTR